MSTSNETKPVGRPTKYDPAYNKQATKLCRLGSTDKQLADFFEIAESTLHTWKIEYPQFLESIKKGREMSDAEIAHSLYHRAKGYKHKETKVMQYQGEIITQEVTKHYPPDTLAAAIWLRNRRPELWRNNPQPQGEDEMLPSKVLIGVVDASKEQADDAEFSDV